MLVEAYTAAEAGDYSVIQTLQALFAAPYDEHNEALADRYYRKTPREMRAKGGVAYFS